MPTHHWLQVERAVLPEAAGRAKAFTATEAVDLVTSSSVSRTAAAALKLVAEKEKGASAL